MAKSGIAIYTNLNNFAQALRDNLKGCKNEKYIEESIVWHYYNDFIEYDEALELGREFKLRKDFI